MKVLHVVGDLGQGGIQNYVCDLIKFQSCNADLDVSMVLLYTKGELWDRAKDSIDEIEYLSMKSARDLGGIVRLFRFIRDSGADIVHVHVIHPLIGLLIRYIGLPAVYTEHGGGLLAGNWKNKLVYRYFHGCFCRLIANSNITRDAIKKVNNRTSGKLEVIYNGIDPDEIDSISGAKLVDYAPQLSMFEHTVGIIARLVSQKGLELFIDTAAEIARLRDDICFVIVGDGPLRSVLQDRINKLNLGDRIIILGYRSDQIRILKSWDIYLFTSLEEAFGLVLIEAMAAGVPVVAARRKTAVAEIISNGQDGIYIEEENPRSLADQVIRLIQDGDLSEKIRGNAKNKVRARFTMSANESLVAEVYRNCIR